MSKFCKKPVVIEAVQRLKRGYHPCCRPESSNERDMVCLGLDKPAHTV